MTLLEYVSSFDFRFEVHLCDLINHPLDDILNEPEPSKWPDINVLIVNK